MAETESTLENQVVGWLAKQGYRLEYLTHKAFRDVGLTSVLGGHIESAEGKPREIDVTVFKDSAHDSKTLVVKALCECKYSLSHPWVLLSSGLSDNLWADWSSIPQSRNLREHSPAVHEYAETLYQSWHFVKGQGFAHSLVQALVSNNRDLAFDSLQKIANAAWDFVETPERRGATDVYLMAIPCLVVEAPLFFAWFDYEANRFSVKQVPYARLSWSGCRSGTVVDVIHADSLSEYARAIKKTFDSVLSVMSMVAE